MENSSTPHPSNLFYTTISFLFPLSFITLLGILSSLPPVSSVTKSAALHLWAFFYPKSGANAVEDVGMVIHERKKVIHERKRVIREHKKVIHERKR